MTKLAARIQSIMARKLLLERVNGAIGDYAKEVGVVAALESQEAFARYEGGEIVRMSLNSMKKHSENVLEGGFGCLDALRVKAHRRLMVYVDRETQQKKPFTKRDLVEKLKGSKAECQQLQGELLVLTLCLKQALQSQDLLVSKLGGAEERARFNKERQDTLSLFSYGVQSEVALSQFQNVVLLKNAR